MVQENKPGAVVEEETLDTERIKRRLDMLDQRLDSIDSIVTAIAERVTRRPITFSLTCPKCGQEIEIAVIGSEKPKV